MNLSTRFGLILTCVFAVIAALLATSYQAGRAKIATWLEDRTEEHAAYLQSAIELQGAGLKGLVSSYSWWSDMVKYVGAPDAAWATDNVDSLAGMPGGADALWVLHPDGSVIHAINAEYRQPAVPFRTPAELQAAIGGSYEFTYFTVIEGSVWQIYGAAVQDPRFWRHETPIVGYLLIGKRWDETWLARMSTLALARLRVVIPAVDTAQPPRAGGYAFRAPIVDPAGQTIATVVGTFDASGIEQVGQSLGEHTLALGLAIVVLLTLLGWFIGLHVVRPLSRITRSLESRNPIHLADLLVAKSDFGEIARLLSSQFRQGRMLQDEIRRRLATIDPVDETRRRESNEALRLRLASDLHDGPLQSLYAAGLKVSSLETAVAAGRPPTPAQLAGIRTILTECSADLRNLLLDLEPEELRDQDLESSLQRFERYMQSVSRTAAQLSIEEGVLDGLARDAQLHLYYITRELISNAARHARPEHASLFFRREAGFLVIRWENDGFTPADHVKPGNGLRNIGQRVQQLDGTWSYRIHRGRAWQVTIEIPFTALTGSMNVSGGTLMSLDDPTPS